MFSMGITIDQFEFRLLIAFGLGALIGLERQWRHKIAGMRTTALVSVGAALFVLLSEKITNDSSSAARIAAQIVTGIGFLGAGVIMKEGFNVTGLNTAATIWCSGAIGSISGMGYWYEGLVGTAVVLSSHLLLRPISRGIDKFHLGEEGEVAYLFKVVCSSISEHKVRDILLRSVEKANLKMGGLQIDDDIDTKRTHITVDIRSNESGVVVIEDIVSIMSMEEAVLSVSWEIEKNKSTK